MSGGQYQPLPTTMGTSLIRTCNNIDMAIDNNSVKIDNNYVTTDDTHMTVSM